MSRLKKIREVLEESEKAANSVTLFIDKLSDKEVEYLRSRIPYQGATPGTLCNTSYITTNRTGYIVTSAKHLGIAIQELIKLRDVEKVKIKFYNNQLVLRAKR